MNSVKSLSITDEEIAKQRRRNTFSLSNADENTFSLWSLSRASRASRLPLRRRFRRSFFYWVWMDRKGWHVWMPCFPR